MKDLGALVNATSKKISAKKNRKNVQSLDHPVAGSGPGSTYGPVVDLEGDEPSEELVQDSAKRQRVRVSSEDPITPIKVVLVRSEK
jgi:mevalonate pyrophosphate decarboxylase